MVHWQFADLAACVNCLKKFILVFDSLLLLAL